MVFENHFRVLEYCSRSGDHGHNVKEYVSGEHGSKVVGIYF